MIKASEMLAARKAAKKEQAVKKYARDNIGNQRTDRNKLANIAVIQVQNKLALRSGAPQDLDSKLTENIKNLMHYQALVYGYDRTSVTVFEKLIRAMRVVACIYSDSSLVGISGSIRRDYPRAYRFKNRLVLRERTNRTVHSEPIHAPETIHSGVIRHHQRRIVTSCRQEDKRERNRIERRSIKRRLALLPRSRV